MRTIYQCFHQPLHYFDLMRSTQTKAFVCVLVVCLYELLTLLLQRCTSLNLRMLVDQIKHSCRFVTLPLVTCPLFLSFAKINGRNVHQTCKCLIRFNEQNFAIQNSQPVCFALELSFESQGFDFFQTRYPMI